MEHFGEQFLHKKDSKLHTSQSVEHEAQRQKELEKRKNEKDRQAVSQRPDDKIANWLEVIEKTHLGHGDDPRVLERIKQYYRNEYVIKAEDVPESAFLLEQKIARQLGHGTIEITDDFKQKKAEQIIGDQAQSLDKWLDYLSSPDATYPTWAKYWAFKAILTMGKFEKQENEITHAESGQFQKRTKDTVASFPPLNPKALAMAIGAMVEKTEKKEIKSVSKKLTFEQFSQLLATESFSKLYAQFLIEMPEYSTEGLQETRGEWVKYNQGDESAPDRLVKSLEGHPLEWCTANINTAKVHLQGGDFYIYYSINQAGEAVIPRLAIRMDGNGIAEVRGIAPDQNIDPYIADIAQQKLNEFPDGQAYEKKSADMKRLTQLEERNNQHEELNKDDLLFLYEVNSPINGFGYQKDPRIKEIIQTRNLREDASLVLDCQPQEIAWGQDEYDEAINNKQEVKAYIGPLFPGIFNLKLECIYTDFPEGKIEQVEMTIGGKSKTELLKDLENRAKSDNSEEKIYISDYARSMINNPEFVVLEKSDLVDLVRLKVSDLGFSGATNIQDIYIKAAELGLELCPPEVGPQLRLNYDQVFKREQPKGEWFYIGMEPVSDSGGYPNVFSVSRDSGGERWLYYDWAGPDCEWRPERELCFRSRKLET